MALVSGSRLLVSFPGMLGTVLKPGTLNRGSQNLRIVLKRTRMVPHLSVDNNNKQISGSPSRPY